MLEQGFANLFRASKFAQYQAGLKQTIVQGSKFGDSFGLKRNLRYKEPMKIVTVKEIDAEFNQTEVEDKYWDCKRIEFFENLLLQMGTDQSKSPLSGYAKNSNLSTNKLIYGTYKPIGKNVYVVGRVLNRCPNGYSVAVAGQVGIIPFSEIPSGNNFTFSDFIYRTAYTFKVKLLNVDAEGKTDLVLSLL